METIDKIKVFESTPHEGAKIETLGKQSIKITHKCGCYLVQHFFAGKIDKNNTMEVNKRERLQADRSYFVELCETHYKAI